MTFQAWNEIRKFPRFPWPVEGEQPLTLITFLKTHVLWRKWNDTCQKRYYLTILLFLEPEKALSQPHGLLTWRPRGQEEYCFSKIQLVGQKYRDNTTLAKLKLDFNPFWPPKSHHFSLLEAITYSPVVVQPIRTQQC